MDGMNLLIIAPGCSLNAGGQSLRVFNWIKMVRDYIRVAYFSTFQKEDPGIANRFYHQRFSDDLSSKIGRLFTYYKTDFSEVCLDKKPDLVQIHTPYFFGLKKWFPDTPVLLVEHNVNWNLLKYEMAAGPTLRKFPLKSPFLPWLQWRAKIWEKKFLKEAAHTFVCSPVDEEEILKELPELANRITTIPNSLDLSRYTPSEKRGEYCLFVGSMTYTANREAIETICEELAPKLPDIPFHIVGGGTYSKPYPPNVHFLGHVPDIGAILENCRLFIAPLCHGSGSRWKILEAFATRRPVLSTPKGAEGLEVTDRKNIWLEEPGPAFLKGLKQLWENSEVADSIAAEGRRLAERKYDYRNFANQVVEIYRGLAGKS